MGFASDTKGYSDFRRRVKRVDPAFYRWGEGARLKDATASRPTASALAGFAWAYVVISVGSNRQLLEASLREGNLSAAAQEKIMMGLGALLMASIMLFALHAVRYWLGNGGKKRNSGGLLVGALGALVLVYTPASVWQTGFGMMDDNSQSMFLTAQATLSDALPGVDLGSVSFVSSSGR